MAEVVNEMPERGSRGVRNESYGKFLDGQVWKLKAGEDYSCDTDKFLSNLRSAAAYRGMRLTVRSMDGAVYVQSHKKTE